MKKILSLVLAALMVFSMIPAVFADDAAKANSYDEAIELLGNEYVWVYHGGVAAEEDVTRAQMALFVSRFITGETDDNYWATEQNDSGFSDLEDQYEAYLGAISFASQKGIVNGYGDGTFGPEDNVEYRQAITMIVRALGFTYKASGYPWSYINKANELGLLDGITGVAYTDAASRGVVAQLLYNALFADVDGASVAEKVFSVGKTTVMITASNDVAYNGSTVLRKDFVQFMEMDDQLEPIGAKYHVPMAQFDIADAATANAYVGTTYDVYYGGNFETILIAEHNDYDVFWNYGNDKTEITISDGSKPDKATLTLGTNAALKIVSQYSNLMNNQGWDADKNGLAQVKVLKDGKAEYAKQYWLVGNVIYDKLMNVVAVYSEITGLWYEKVDGVYAIASQDKIDNYLLGAAGGSGLGATDATTSAYTKALASDNNGDGLYDKAFLRNYYFGTIAKDGGKAKYELGMYGKNDFYPEATVDGAKWTGLEAGSKAYAVFCVDGTEVEVLFTVPAKSAETTDTYYAYGYVRAINYDANTITVGSEVLNVGYDSLLNSPLKAAKTGNRDYLYGFFNQYVKYVVVDNQVVYVEAADIDTNYVIIDEFVGFTEEGIVANGWSTVANGYTQFVVSSLNGWTIKGLDFDLYFLSQLINSSLQDSNFDKHWINLGLQFIPVEQGELYQIVYTEADGSLNLTAPISQVAKNGDEWEDVYFEFTKSGFMKNTTGANDYEVADTDRKYVPLTEGDFWMILVKAPEFNQRPETFSITDTMKAFINNGYMVITVNGKMNSNIEELYGLDAYKLVKGDDYVFVADELNWSIRDLIATEAYVDADYYMYNAEVSFVSNVEFLNNTFVYSIPMINVLTGKVETVRFEADIYDVSNFQGTGYITDLVEDGKIYKAVDGKIEIDIVDGELLSYELCDIITILLENTQVGDAYHAPIGAGTDIFSYTDIVTYIAKEYAHDTDAQMDDTKYWELFKNKTLKVLVVADGQVKVATKDDHLKLAGNQQAHVDAFVTADGVTIWVTDVVTLDFSTMIAKLAGEDAAVLVEDDSKSWILLTLDFLQDLTGYEVSAKLFAGDTVLTTVTSSDTCDMAAGEMSLRIMAKGTSSSWDNTTWTKDDAKVPTAVEVYLNGIKVLAYDTFEVLVDGVPTALTADLWAAFAD